MRERIQEVIKLQKEILEHLKAAVGKAELLEHLTQEAWGSIKKKGFVLPVEYDETKRYHKLTIETESGLGGRIYIPKTLDFMPDRVLLMETKKKKKNRSAQRHEERISRKG